MSDNNNCEKTADIIFGRWKSQILYTGVKLGIFDCIASHAKSASDISNELGLDDKLAYRLLRALSSMGLLKEEPNLHGFSITPQGELLRKGSNTIRRRAGALCHLETLTNNDKGW